MSESRSKHDDKGGRYLNSYDRYEISEAGSDNLAPILDVAIKRLKGNPPAYENSTEGLKKFMNTCVSYFEYIQTQNKRPGCKKIIPDIEGLSMYLGITRKTLNLYQKERGTDWKDAIDLVKNAIMSVKKELAFHQQIPTVYAIFDQVNNSDYRNVSEFKLVPETENDKMRPKQTAADIAARHKLSSQSKEMPQLPDDL